MFRANKLIFLVCIIFAVLYSALSLIHHTHFLSGGFDLGIFDQALWQYAHFTLPYNTIKEKIILGDHLNLTLPLLAPLFWLWEDIKIVLIFQAFWISFSGLPIFKYLLKRGFTGFQALILAVIYLLFYGMQYLIYFDFHPVAIGVGLLAWILYFWEAEKWRWFGLSIFLLLLTQENMGLALFGLCLIWVFQKKRLKLVLLLAVISILYTILAFGAIKLIAHGDLQYVPQLPSSLNEFVGRFFDTQDKKEVWLFSFGWFSFLPLLSPGAIMATVLDLAQYFTTGKNFDHMWSPYLHHRAILAIFLLAGTADALLFLKTKKINLTLVILLMFIAALFWQLHYHFALNKLLKSDYWRTEAWMRDNDAILAKVPVGESVVTQQSLVPHLSHRQQIYLLYPRQRNFKTVCQKKTCWWLEFAGRPKYLVVDAHASAWVTMTLADITDFKAALKNMEDNKVISPYYQQNDARIYTINYQNLEALQR